MDNNHIESPRCTECGTVVYFADTTGRCAECATVCHYCDKTKRESGLPVDVIDHKFGMLFAHKSCHAQSQQE